MSSYWRSCSRFGTAVDSPISGTMWPSSCLYIAIARLRLRAALDEAEDLGGLPVPDGYKHNQTQTERATKFEAVTEWRLLHVTHVNEQCK